MQPPEPVKQEPPLARIGKYRLEHELNRGGMGAVWVAYDEQLQRKVAIKLMHSLESGNRGGHERFEREAQTIAQMQHPNVVQVYDCGISDDHKPYLVMELLQGMDLASRLRRSSTLSAAAFAPIFMEVTKALEAAHEAGVIHRDLKPANIFLARQGADTVTKILDFGVAAIHSRLPSGDMELTGEDRLVGTPQYMSPEQATTGEIDRRTDLWALGVVTYEALVGQLPFRADSLTALLMKICMSEHEAPSARGMSASFDGFFARALAKEPTQRFGSAREMAAAFAELVENLPTTQPTKILVIDDEPDLQRLIKQCFRRLIRDKRYEFLFARDGKEALEQLCVHPDVDVALTDINMPGMDGLTFLSKVGEVSPMLKSVVISAYSDMGNIRRAMNFGAFDFLVKPLDFRDLEATVEKAVREVRDIRRALRTLEENNALRMLVDTALLERLLPLLRVSGDISAEALEATVVVADIHGVRAYARTATPQELVDLLNHHFDVIVPAMSEHNGAVVRFIGDAAMAVFHGDDHALRAARSCIALRDKLVALAREDASSAYVHGVCIGLASGTVISGTVGAPSKRRLDYTLLGEIVSTALLLAQVAKQNQVLIPEPLMAELSPRFHCCKQDQLVNDPAGQPIVVCAVVDELRADTSHEAGDGKSSTLLALQSTERGEPDNSTTLV